MRFHRNTVGTVAAVVLLLAGIALLALPSVLGASEKQARRLAAEATVLLDRRDGRDDDIAAARKSIDAALQLDPHCADALVQRARWRMKSGGLGPVPLRTAEADLRSALNTDPGHAGAYVLLGYVLTYLLRYDEAADALEAARKLGSTSFWLEVNTGDLLLAQGKLDDAEKHYDRMFHDDNVPGPMRIDGYLNLAKRWGRRGDAERGRKIFQRMFAVGINDPVVLSNYSHFLRTFLLELDEAEAVGRRALTNWRRDDETCVRRNVSAVLYLRWAEALVNEKDLAKADRFFAEAKSYEVGEPDFTVTEIGEYPRAHPIVVALAAEGYSLDDIPGLEPGTGTSPLMIAASRNNEAIARQLIESGAALDRRDVFGDAPLQIAAERGRPAIVEMLLAAGADPTLQNKRGQDAEAMARKNGHTEIANRLAQARSSFAGPHARPVRARQTAPSRYNPRPTDNRAAVPPTVRQSC